MIFSGNCHYKPTTNVLATTTQNKNKCISLDLLKDLRLGTKVRVISEIPFPWMSKMTYSGFFNFSFFLTFSIHSMHFIKIMLSKKKQLF